MGSPSMHCNGPLQFCFDNIMYVLLSSYQILDSAVLFSLGKVFTLERSRLDRLAYPKLKISKAYFQQGRDWIFHLIIYKFAQAKGKQISCLMDPGKITLHTRLTLNFY